MIGRIAGVLLEKQAPELLIDVQGIGYEVQVSLNTFFDLPQCGEQVSLHTHFVVREDAQLLYGFGEKSERELFRILIKVSGVGPKLALTILSGMPASDFVRSIQANDTAALIKLPGVGKKTAERLIIEVRDRLASFSVAEGDTPSLPLSGRQSDAAVEAESALIALGYKPQEASRMVAASIKQIEAKQLEAKQTGQSSSDLNQLTSEELIRLSLKSMVRN